VRHTMCMAHRKTFLREWRQHRNKTLEQVAEYLHMSHSQLSRIAELIARWDANEGKPYKGSLIDWSAYEADNSNIGCMCAQGQVLHLLAGWTPEQLRNTDQDEADRETAKRLNISVAHSILLRNINDKADGAPSIVLTNPEKVLGDQAHIVLAFWLHLDRMKARTGKTPLGPPLGPSLRAAARAAARDAAGTAAAWDAAWGRRWGRR
jgi:hypothetical protein